MQQGGDEQKWQKTAGAKQLREDLMTHELDVLLCERLKQVLKIKDGTARREFAKLFNTRKLGVGIQSTGAGKRSNHMQSEFRDALLTVSNARHPNEKRNMVWCVVTGVYHNELSVTAGHIGDVYMREVYIKKVDRKDVGMRERL